MKSKSRDIAIIFNENNTLSIQNVAESNADCVETDQSILYLADAKTYIDASRGSLVHLFNVDLPARVEAENLKNLRRSTALKRVFEFDRSDGNLDWKYLIPYVIIALLIFFK
jgi:hypothetical protein